LNGWNVMLPNIRAGF